jgi:SAM-dependent methyltransferase
VERYLDVVKAEWPQRNPGNLRFYLRHLFRGIDLRGRRVLDVGAGDGIYSLYAAAAGAEHVVALEPEAQGSRQGMRRRFERARRRLGVEEVELRPDTFQDFDPHGEAFDVVLLHSSINHLDEDATTALHRDPGARGVYRRLLAKLARLSAPGARLIVVDCSRDNLFARLGRRNPLQPTIEWEKHQAPETWVELLKEVGFDEPRVRWRTLNSLRQPGRLLLGNRLVGWLTLSAFHLTMRFSRPDIVPRR